MATISAPRHGILSDEMSNIANSINPDGVRAQEVIESLQEDIEEELGHAQQFAHRIKELYGVVIRGVIEAEVSAIEHYNRIIDFCERKDPVTQDMVITILHDEEGHRRLFEGFLREYQAEGPA